MEVIRCARCMKVMGSLIECEGPQKLHDMSNPRLCRCIHPLYARNGRADRRRALQREYDGIVAKVVAELRV